VLITWVCKNSTVIINNRGRKEAEEEIDQSEKKNIAAILSR